MFKIAIALGQAERLGAARRPAKGKAGTIARGWGCKRLVKCSSGKGGKRERGDQSVTDCEQSIEIPHYLRTSQQLLPTKGLFIPPLLHFSLDMATSDSVPLVPCPCAMISVPALPLGARPDLGHSVTDRGQDTALPAAPRRTARWEGGMQIKHRGRASGPAPRPPHTLPYFLSEVSWCLPAEGKDKRAAGGGARAPCGFQDVF